MRSRRTSLEHRHSALDAELAQETNRPVPDRLRLSELKRQKMRILDAMSSLERRDRRRRRARRA